MGLSRLEGVFPIIKPAGITSSRALNYLKDKLITESKLSGQYEHQRIKMGHGGTLDASATGILVVGVGAGGCKRLRWFLHGNKTYISTCRLGAATDTYDTEGRVTEEKPYDHVTEELLRSQLMQFKGQIQQVPPPFSALKRNGKRLSQWTLEGVTLEIEPRTVRCYELELEDFTPPLFTLRIHCGAGFYVRSLVHDLGHAVGSCAHVRGLRRTRQGPFSTSDALSEPDWRLDGITSSIEAHRRSVDNYCEE